MAQATSAQQAANTKYCVDVASQGVSVLVECRTAENLHPLRMRNSTYPATPCRTAIPLKMSSELSMYELTPELSRRA